MSGFDRIRSDGLGERYLPPPEVEVSQEGSLSHRIDQVVASSEFSEVLVLDQEGPYLDANRLIKGAPQDQPIKPEHRDWYLNAAILLGQADKAVDRQDTMTARRLELAALQAYSKAATVSNKRSESLKVQTSPFLHEDFQYHRSTGAKVLFEANKAVAKTMDLEPYETYLVHSSLFQEVLQREYPHKDLDLNIDSMDKYESLVDKLISDAAEGRYPDHLVIMDISGLVKQRGTGKSEIRQLTWEMEEYLVQKVLDLKDNEATSSLNLQGLAEKLFGKLFPLAYSELEGCLEGSGQVTSQMGTKASVLITPNFLFSEEDSKISHGKEKDALIESDAVYEGRGGLVHRIPGALIRTGFWVSPDTAKSVLLDLEGDAGSLLRQQGLARPELATNVTFQKKVGSNEFQAVSSGEQQPLPHIADSFSDLLAQPIGQKFRALGQSNQEDLPPYLQVLPEATCRILEGLDEAGVKEGLESRELEDLLQLSFFRIMNAMGEAIFKRNDQMAFQNQFELIHQEVQNLLQVTQPYTEGTELSDCLLDRMVYGDKGMVPKDLGSMKAYAKPSAMHCLASTLASVEAQKGSNELNVAVLKDSYYESSHALDRAKTHSVCTLDGDTFNERGIDDAIGDTPPDKPLDVFVCELHHNVSITRQSYTPERVKDQIKALFEKGWVAEPFTVVIDSTINLEQAEDLRDLYQDPDIQDFVKRGALNLVVLRSAQKFDMLGLDNYYGGIVTTVNDGSSFSDFDERMGHPDDQLRGLSYQGLTHLERYAGSSMDEYRQLIMENTQKLYAMIPDKARYSEGNDNPLQVSEIKDEKIVFLDIKFPHHEEAGKAFRRAFFSFCEKEALPLTNRASFGFPNSNFTTIEGAKYRLNPGLDDEKVIARYGAFFQAAQEAIAKGMKAVNRGQSLLRKEAEVRASAKGGNVDSVYNNLVSTVLIQYLDRMEVPPSRVSASVKGT